MEMKSFLGYFKNYKLEPKKNVKNVKKAQVNQGINSPDFQEAVATVLMHEGGYVNHVSDPGGETNFGITKRSYPNRDIKNLTKQDAIEIYYKDWWVRRGYDKFTHPKVAAKLFDTAINMGAKQAHKLLQRALRAVGNSDIVDDGILGNMSKEALEKSNEMEVLSAFRSEQAGYYRLLVAKRPKFKAFIKGWIRRAYS